MTIPDYQSLMLPGPVCHNIKVFSFGKGTANFLSKRIVLIDGDQVSAVMVRQNIGYRIEERLHIKKIDEELFEA